MSNTTKEIARILAECITVEGALAFESHEYAIRRLKAINEVVAGAQTTLATSPLLLPESAVEAMQYTVDQLAEFKPEALEGLGLVVAKEKLDAALIEAKPENKLYLITHDHKHGTDTYLVLSDHDPSNEEVIAAHNIHFDGGEEDEVDLHEEFLDVGLYNRDQIKVIPAASK